MVQNVPGVVNSDQFWSTPVIPVQEHGAITIKDVQDVLLQ